MKKGIIFFIFLVLSYISQNLQAYIIEEGFVKGKILNIDVENKIVSVKPESRYYYNINIAVRKEAPAPKPDKIDFQISDKTLFVFKPVDKILLLQKKLTHLEYLTINSEIGVKYEIDAIVNKQIPTNGTNVPVQKKSEKIYKVLTFSLINRYEKPVIDPTKYFQGIVKNNNHTSRQLTLLDNKMNQVTFTILSNTPIYMDRLYDKYQTRKFTGLKDIQPKDSIVIAYHRKNWMEIYTNQAQVNNEEYSPNGTEIVEEVSILQMYIKPIIDRRVNFTGIITAIDTEKSIITVQSNTNLKNFYIEATNNIVLYNKLFYPASRLSINDKVSITYTPMATTNVDTQKEEALTNTSTSLETNITSTNILSNTNVSTNIPPAPPLNIEYNINALTLLHHYTPPIVNYLQKFYGTIKHYNIAMKTFEVTNKKEQNKKFLFDDEKTDLYWGGGLYPFELLKNGDKIGISYKYDSDDMNNFAVRIDIDKFYRDKDIDIYKTSVIRVSGVNLDIGAITGTNNNGELVSYRINPKTKFIDNRDNIGMSIEKIVPNSTVCIGYHADRNGDIHVDTVNQIKKYITPKLPPYVELFTGEIIEVLSAKIITNAVFPYPNLPAITVFNHKTALQKTFYIRTTKTNSTKIFDDQLQYINYSTADDLKKGQRVAVRYLHKASWNEAETITIRFRNDPIIPSPYKFFVGIVKSVIPETNGISINTNSLLDKLNPPKPVLYTITTIDTNNNESSFIFSITNSKVKKLNHFFLRYPDVEEGSEIAIIYSELSNKNYIRDIIEKKPAPEEPPIQYFYVDGYVQVYDDKAKDNNNNPTITISIKDRKGEIHNFIAYPGKTRFKVSNADISPHIIMLEDYVGIAYYVDENNNRIAVDIVAKRPYKYPPKNWKW